MLINLSKNFIYSNKKSFGNNTRNSDVTEKNNCNTDKNIQKQNGNINEKNNSTIIIPAVYGLDYFAHISSRIGINQTTKKSEADKINEVLESKYGIKSDIKNLDILKPLNNVIKDFCNINKNNDLFRSDKYKLVLSEKSFVNKLENEKKIKDKKNLIDIRLNNGNKEFQILFNQNINNWKEEDNREIKERYNSCLISTDNPNYNLYRVLTSFLLCKNNYQSGQIIYNVTKARNNGKSNNTDNVRTSLLKLTLDSRSGSIMNSYIVSKMCRVPTSKFIDKLYEQLSGNKINLKFPEIKEEQVHIKEASFEELDEITNKLKHTYGINVDFKGNTTYAKPILLSVESLTKAANNKNLFNGLNIEVDKKYFNSNKVSGKCISDTQTGKRFVAFNPGLDLEGLEKETRLAYEDGLIAANNIVHSSITHELAHWLQWGANDNFPYPIIDQGIQFINKYEDGTVDTKDCYKSTKQDCIESLSLLAAAKVSNYAATDAGEFCSEYIAGKMDGKKYPKITDILFETLYRGPKLNFPETDMQVNVSHS